MPYNIDSLRQACQASDANSEKTVYSTDASTIRGEALAVAWPTNIDELQKLMRIVSREKILITLRGGGTSLVGGASPINSMVIDMSKMNKIKAISTEEMFAIVEPGVVLDNLNEALSQFGLEFPIQPGSHAACTVGGIIATNAAGMLSQKYGKVDDWVAGLTIMDGTGKVFSMNNIEAKEIIGSEGCCAIIVEAKLKLNTKTYETSSDLFSFDNLSDMLGKLEELRMDKDVLAIEYINRPAAKFSELKNGEYLLVKYLGSKGKMKSAAGEDDGAWKIRENLYSILVEQGYERIEDPQVDAVHMMQFLEWLNKRGIPAYGHISSGILHPHFKRGQNELNEMFDFVKSVNGKLASEHGIGILKKKYAPFAFGQKIKQLKDKYDPLNLLNKGKII